MLFPLLVATLLTLLITLTLAATARLQAILPHNRPRPQRRRGLPTTSTTSRSSTKTSRSRRLERASRDEGTLTSPNYPYKHIMLVLGSGGHTAEMLLMLQMVDMARWKKRSWIVSSGDGFSETMAGESEARLLREKEEQGKYEIVELPRARRVHQSLLTTPVTSLICLWAALKLLARDTPDVVLTNGPGTGVIVVLASFILRFFNLAGSGKTRCVYIESLARCKKLSLSGRLLNGFVDRFLVQWPELEKGRVEFKGCFALDAAVGVGMDGVDKRADLHKSEWISYEL